MVLLSLRNLGPQYWQRFRPLDYAWSVRPFWVSMVVSGSVDCGLGFRFPQLQISQVIPINPKPETLAGCKVQLDSRKLRPSKPQTVTPNSIY